MDATLSSAASSNSSITSAEEDSSSVLSSKSSLTTLVSCFSASGQEKLCCCVSVEDFPGEQPIAGWENRSVISPTNSHILSQNLDKSLVLEHNPSPKSSVKNSKQPLSKGSFSLGTDSKSSLRSYMQFTPTIAYKFNHCVDGDISTYIEEYRNSYTYPNQERNKRSFASTTTLVKPTLYTLDGSVMQLQIPLTNKKQGLGQCRLLSRSLSKSASRPDIFHCKKHKRLGIPRSTYKVSSLLDSSLNGVKLKTSCESSHEGNIDNVNTLREGATLSNNPSSSENPSSVSSQKKSTTRNTKPWLVYPLPTSPSRSNTKFFPGNKPEKGSQTIACHEDTHLASQLSQKEKSFLTIKTVNYIQ